MAKIIIDQLGVKNYYNNSRDHHREDGPAVIKPNGEKYWLINSRYKRYINREGIHIEWFVDASRKLQYPSGFKVSYGWFDLKERVVWPEL